MSVRGTAQQWEPKPPAGHSQAKKAEGRGKTKGGLPRYLFNFVIMYKNLPLCEDCFARTTRMTFQQSFLSVNSWANYKNIQPKAFLLKIFWIHADAWGVHTCREQSQSREKEKYQKHCAWQNFCMKMKHVDLTGHNGSGKLLIVFQCFWGQWAMKIRGNMFSKCLLSPQQTKMGKKRQRQ